MHRPDKKRGRHKKRHSPETVTWEQGHMIPPRPEWMSPETYAKLAQLRNKEER